MEKKDFLIEVGCEELPFHCQEPLVNRFAHLLQQACDAEQLQYGAVQVYASPRRLAVWVADLVAMQPSKETLRQGPSYEQAFKAGVPTPACLGFAKSCGVTVDQLEALETASGGRRVFYRKHQAGQMTVALLPELISRVVKQLPLSKPMRWGSHAFMFARPVHWLLVLYGREPIAVQLWGKQAADSTLGHRFLHPDAIRIAEPRHYSSALYSPGYVIAHYGERKAKVEKLLYEAVEPGCHPVITDPLLNEVTALVEWPVALLGKFNLQFLTLPHAVLTMAMATHLKCFPVKDTQGELLPYFVIISNMVVQNPQRIIQGNESVLNARLSDAAFFYNNDLAIPLEKRLPDLHHVVFHKQLGSLADKSKRLVKLTAYIAQQIGADADLVQRAAQLSKCDLLSEVVTEFPALQGVMGRIYAAHQGEPERSAIAIEEHYLPRFSGDVLPEHVEGCVLAVADRLDTLLGILGGQSRVAGDGDPYGLRRAALGVLRILIEKKWAIDLYALIQHTMHIVAETQSVREDAADQVLRFILSRLRVWYQEQQQVAGDIFEAVLARHPTSLFDFHQRVKAVQHFQTLPEAAALAAANKRVSNLLKKSKLSDLPAVDVNLLEQDAEKELAEQLAKQKTNASALYESGCYMDVLTQLSALKQPIDIFFDQVLVMDPDPQKQLNRLALLAMLRGLLTQVADLSLLS